MFASAKLPAPAGHSHIPASEASRWDLCSDSVPIIYVLDNFRQGVSELSYINHGEQCMPIPLGCCEDQTSSVKWCF